MNNSKIEAQEVTNSELAEVKGGAAEVQELAPGIASRLDHIDLSGLKALEADQLRVGNGFFAFRFNVV